MIAGPHVDAGARPVRFLAPLLLAGLAALVAWADGPIGLRLPLGLVAVLLLPGYALTMLLFPRRELETIERLGLSFALSLSVLAVLAILLNSTPWGFGPGPIVVAVTAWTTLVLAGAWMRSRDRSVSPTPPVEVAEQHARVTGQRARREPIPLGLLAAGLGATVMTVGLAYGYVLLAPPAVSTELYLLGPRGWAADVPRAIRIGESVPVTIGVVNHEPQATAFRIRADVGGTPLADFGPVSLVTGERWEVSTSIAPPSVGPDQDVVVTLRKEDAVDPYRAVHIRLDVLPSRDDGAAGGNGTRASGGREVGR